MAETKSGPGMGLVTSKKYALAILWVSAIGYAFQASTSVMERCTLACTGAFVVAAYLVAQALVEREAVEHGTSAPVEEAPNAPAPKV
jgi:hypothetical protein